MYNYTNIRKVHLEISTRCNAACPGCPRNLCGVDVIDDFPLYDMSLPDAQAIFTSAFLKQLDAILINGNLGDFVTARDGLAIVEYFLAENPQLNLSISTNAGIRSDVWKRLAELGVVVHFCIDGLEGTHELYRQQTRWATVVENAKQFINAGGTAHWKMIRFDHNEHQVDQCRALAKEYGFAVFDFVDHGRSDFPVFDQKGMFQHNIGSHTLPTQFEKILWVHHEGMDSPVTRPETKNISCEVAKGRSVYITATGEVYPCCWLGFYPRSMYHQDNKRIAELLPGSNNAKEVGIAAAIKWFNRIEESWHSDQLIPCATYCGA